MCNCSVVVLSLVLLVLFLLFLSLWNIAKQFFIPTGLYCGALFHTISQSRGSPVVITAQALCGVWMFSLGTAASSTV